MMELDAFDRVAGSFGSRSLTALDTHPLLVQARSDAEFAIAHALFREYADQLGVDLCFQGFAAELQTLDTMYGPPGGCLILARRPDMLLGTLTHNPSPASGAGQEYFACIGVRRVCDNVCEMKRLYVRNAARGTGLGRRLAQAAIDAARAIGYTRMVLDTLGSMTAARTLYSSLGFKEIPAYYDNPIPGVTYMGLDLRSAGPGVSLPVR
jgi:putative acetyltransferase